jgi:predicted MPP superfamily phosphohydrolase
VQESTQGDFRLKAWPILGILSIQAILFLAHWFIYLTLIRFVPGLNPGTIVILRWALLSLAFSFVIAALLGYRFSNSLVGVLYKAASVWMGFLNFFFFAACSCWLVWVFVLAFDPHGATLETRPLIAGCLFGLALAAGVYGLVNAGLVRVRRIPVRLLNLPVQWRGRTAVLITDLHLGHINGAGFSRRIVARAAELRPDVAFIAGDFFDGSRVDAERMAAPFQQLALPFGIYFATGNHDEFGETPHFLAALKHAGIRVLSNEKVIVDGLQIIGVPYHDTTYPMRFRATLESLGIERNSASILISHVPNRLPIVEEVGVSLQLSGHTHGGQFVPFTWLTRRVFGKFTHGLHSFGALQVYTSYGAGTWGPPMRVGTTPEIVLLEFV